MVPTKRGVGVQLWGTHDDLEYFYDAITHFFLGEDNPNIPGVENRLKLLSSFSYEVRKAYEGARLKRSFGHFSMKDQQYLGTQISWVHALFSFAGLKYAMNYQGMSKMDVALILQLEYWLEKAMRSFDPKGAEPLLEYINGGLYGGNDCIYHYMRFINAEFIELGGGKRAFRRLPDLLKKGVVGNDAYYNFMDFLTKEAKRLNCSIDELDFDDDHVNYEIPW
jgi:hypothetical protein